MDSWLLSILWVVIQYYNTYFVAQLGSTWVGLYESCLASQCLQSARTWTSAWTRALGRGEVGLASAKYPTCDHLILY